MSDKSSDKPVVSWGKSAFNALQNAYQYILSESPSSAERVRENILTITRRLPNNPERYPLDVYKRSNPGNYRAFIKHSYRVSYRHTEKVIKILRVRHVKQKPKEY